jgi:hypothetical protein
VQVRWKDVRRLYVSYAPVPQGGEDAPIGYRHCVETSDHRIVEVSGLADIEELWDAIEAEVERTQAAQVQHRTTR